MKRLGILFVILGVITIIVTGFNYVTAQKSAELQPVIQNSQNESYPLNWAPVIGVALLLAGILIFTIHKNQS